MVRMFLINEASLFPELKFYFLSLSTTLIAAGGYIINDYYDVKIDLINKPNQLLVGKSFSRRHAIIMHFVINYFGLFIGFMVSWKIAVVNLFCAFLLWFYSNRLKQLPLLGNLTISLLTAIAVLVLALYYKQLNPIIFLFALYAFFITLVREIVKDIEDIKGDAVFGCRTLPIAIGIRASKSVIYGVIALLLGSYISLSLYLRLYSFSYFIYSLLLAIMILYLLFSVFRADTKKEFSYLSQYTKLIMLVGILGISII
jgi:4-hydroxybenzoate polyprenyltransferase